LAPKSATAANNKNIFDITFISVISLLKERQSAQRQHGHRRKCLPCNVNNKTVS